MFGQDLQAKVRSATATRKASSEDVVSAQTAVVLAFDYTVGVAGKMGERGAMLQQALSEGHLKTCALDLQSQLVVAAFGDGGNADDRLRLNSETRVTNLGLRAPPKESACPVATLTIVFPTEYDHLLFFVDRLDEIIPMRVELQQTEMEV